MSRRDAAQHANQTRTIHVARIRRHTVVIASTGASRSTLGPRQIKALAKKLTLHFSGVVRSGAYLERWQILFGDAFAWQDDTEAINDQGEQPQPCRAVTQRRRDPRAGARWGE